jgi:hypothetical protein
VAVGDGQRDITVAVLIDDLSGLHSTLDSVTAQTLPTLDLVVVVPSGSAAATDQVGRRLREIAPRFTTVTLACPTAALASLRDVAFDASETAFVLSVWSGDRLTARACDDLAAALTSRNAGYAWAPVDEPAEEIDSNRRDLVLLPGGVRRHATTLVTKEAWAAGGGFVDTAGEPNDQIWERLVHRGLGGVGIPDPALETASTPAN